MITKIEIDGFKTFDDFSIELSPFSAIVGPNASGKSNLFDVVKLLSELASEDVRSAITKLRGEPGELFRRTTKGVVNEMKFAVEVLLPPRGSDQFGTTFSLKTQRLRYEVCLKAISDEEGNIDKVVVAHERCERIKKSDETAYYLKNAEGIQYGVNMPQTPLLDTVLDENGAKAFHLRQDGPNKRGKPTRIPAMEASRSGLSTVQTAEFPHLYALKDFLSHPSFLEINPSEARRENDRFEEKTLYPSASNLAAVLDRIKSETASSDQPDGSLIDISNELSRLIPSVKRVYSVTTQDKKEYSYEIEMSDGLRFSSRVISDGTLRLLALISLLNDPRREGLLCFEEPENGIHEGRIGALVELIRRSTERFTEDYFQIIMNTHSPVVMRALNNDEIIAADIVSVALEGKSTRKTRMRRSPSAIGDLINPERVLTRFEVESLLRGKSDAA